MTAAQTAPANLWPVNDVVPAVVAGVARPGDVLVLKIQSAAGVEAVEAAIKHIRQHAPGVAVLACGPDAGVEIKPSTEDRQWLGG